jgi:hypothetical protein
MGRPDGIHSLATGRISAIGRESELYMLMNAIVRDMECWSGLGTQTRATATRNGMDPTGLVVVGSPA